VFSYVQEYIVFTWNPQNKIIIGHWDVELAMILSVFIFQVFGGVLVPACEHLLFCDSCNKPTQFLVLFSLSKEIDPI